MSESTETIAEQLARIGGLDLYQIEQDLAYASVAPNRRGHINWSLFFPWLKGKMSEMQEHRCYWCHELMCEDAHSTSPTFDHIVPLSKGGKDEPSNIGIACYTCNHDRGDGTPQYRPYSRMIVAEYADR